MFKGKKNMALCATTLVGISALGSFAPMTASADVAKEGQTTVIYEDTPKPEEWGLFVPSTIKLDKNGETVSVAHRNNYSVKYGTGQVKIIQEDGSDYPTGKSFTVDAQATRFASANSRSVVDLYALNHGTSEPTGSYLGNIDNVWLTGGNSGSLEFDANSRSNWVSFSVKIMDLQNSNLLKQNINSTISWTAKEKTS